MKKHLFIFSFYFITGMAIVHAQDECDTLKLKFSNLLYLTDWEDTNTASKLEGAIINIDSFPYIYTGMTITNVSTDTFFANEDLGLFARILIYTDTGLVTGMRTFYTIKFYDLFPNDSRRFSINLRFDLWNIVDYAKEFGIDFDEITFCTWWISSNMTSKDGFYSDRIIFEAADTANFRMIRNEVSVKDLEMPQTISVFPNPAQSQFTVTNAQNAVLRLYNTLGQEVLQTHSKEKNVIIDISDLSQGLYVLKIKKENAILTRKVQIMR
jgi:hypothetical protein